MIWPNSAGGSERVFIIYVWRWWFFNIIQSLNLRIQFFSFWFHTKGTIRNECVYSIFLLLCSLFLCTNLWYANYLMIKSGEIVCDSLMHTNLTTLDKAMQVLFLFRIHTSKYWYVENIIFFFVQETDNKCV